MSPLVQLTKTAKRDVLKDKLDPRTHTVVYIYSDYAETWTYFICTKSKRKT